MSSSFFTPTLLKYWYIKNHLSTYEIAKKSGCDPKTVYYWLKNYNIPTRPRKIITTDKTTLLKLYNSGLSLKEIGKRINCTPAAVLRKFRKFSIDTRSPWETNTIHIKHNFSNDPSEKAYLIGFRIGDLNVTQKSSRSSIIVKSNTTHQAQVKLLKNLFSKYGPVWISQPKSSPSVYHFTASLNNSFSFLIPKHKTIPTWILKPKKDLWPFLAGYTDAEGSIGIYQGRAKFRIGSYDIGILQHITDALINYGIKVRLRLERPKNSRDRRGVTLRGNFWRMTVNDQYSLLRLFNGLLPYLKHGKRYKDLSKAKQNIFSRIVSQNVTIHI